MSYPYLTIDVSHVWTGADGLQHSSVDRAEMFDGLRKYANFPAVNFAGVHNVIINDDTEKITSAAGYTSGRGMFCDLYK